MVRTEARMIRSIIEGIVFTALLVVVYLLGAML